MIEEYKMVIEKLSSIMDWIEAYRQAKHNRTSEDDFSDDCLEIANNTRDLLMVCISLDPNSDISQSQLTQSQATVIGNAVRAFKIYDTIILMFSEGRGEMIAILGRLIIETIAKMKFLMKATDEKRKRYILESYKPVVIRYKLLLEASKERDLTDIETRMKEGWEWNMTNDNVSLEEVCDLPKGSLFGNLEQLINEEMGTISYDFAYRSGSEHVHGGWNDLTDYHVYKTKQGYAHKLDYESIETRYLNPLTVIIIREFIGYIDWANSDPKSIIKPIMNELHEIASKFDKEHEKFVCSRQ